MQKPTQEQTTEWFESLVTEYFFTEYIVGLLEEANEELQNQGFDTLSAEQLQAQRGHLWGLRAAFEGLASVYEEKSLEIEEEDEGGEHLGDSS